MYKQFNEKQAKLFANRAKTRTKAPESKSEFIRDQKTIFEYDRIFGGKIKVGKFKVESMFQKDDVRAQMNTNPFKISSRQL